MDVEDVGQEAGPVSVLDPSVKDLGQLTVAELVDGALEAVLCFLQDEEDDEASMGVLLDFQVARNLLEELKRRVG